MQFTLTLGTLLVAVSSFVTVAVADPCKGAYFTDLIPAPANCTRHTRKNDTITVDYKGYFPNGTVFDQSYNSTDGPYDGTFLALGASSISRLMSRVSRFVYQYGVGQVIKGFDEGLAHACVGGTQNYSSSGSRCGC